MLACSARAQHTSDPARKMFRQICGAIAEYEKARLVARLKRAREQARIKKGGKCEGRKSHAEIRPDVVDLANRLRHARSGKQRSLRGISAELAKCGHVNNAGHPFAAMSVRDMMRLAI